MTSTDIRPRISGTATMAHHPATTTEPGCRDFLSTAFSFFMLALLAQWIRVAG
jgi:hypothetical protein